MFAKRPAHTGTGATMPIPATIRAGDSPAHTGTAPQAVRRDGRNCPSVKSSQQQQKRQKDQLPLFFRRVAASEAAAGGDGGY